MADGKTLQLNVTFISGLPKTLKCEDLDNVHLARNSPHLCVGRVDTWATGTASFVCVLKRALLLPTTARRPRRTVRLGSPTRAPRGRPCFLADAWHDYPTMTVFSPTSGRPAPPFNATIVASPK